MTLREEFERICWLREDAIKLGFVALALAYGWWAMRVGKAMIEQQLADAAK